MKAKIVYDNWGKDYVCVDDKAVELCDAVRCPYNSKKDEDKLCVGCDMIWMCSIEKRHINGICDE